MKPRAVSTPIAHQQVIVDIRRRDSRCAIVVPASGRSTRICWLGRWSTLRTRHRLAVGVAFLLSKQKLFLFITTVFLLLYEFLRVVQNRIINLIGVWVCVIALDYVCRSAAASTVSLPQAFFLCDVRAAIDPISLLSSHPRYPANVQVSGSLPVFVGIYNFKAYLYKY